MNMPAIKLPNDWQEKSWNELELELNTKKMIEPPVLGGGGGDNYDNYDNYDAWLDGEVNNEEEEAVEEEEQEEELMYNEVRH